MSYICAGCGTETAYGLLVCQNCQHWMQHVAQLTRERDDAVAARAEAFLRADLEFTKLRALLREVEWVIEEPWTAFPVAPTAMEPSRLWCPLCHEPKAEGHLDDCRLKAALEGHHDV